MTAIWNKETDVVVIGAGGAGLAAAVGAAEAGSEVIVIEVLDSILKSNTAMCGGVMMGAETSIQQKAGVSDSIEEFDKYLSVVGDGFEDPELRRLWAEDSGKTVNWIAEMGVDFPVEMLYMSGVEKMYEDVVPAVPRGHITSVRSGRPIVEALYQTAQNSNVQFMFETKGKRLITGPENDIQGVEVEKAGESITIKARQGVILATAGFSRNEHFIKNFMPKMMSGGSFGSEWQQGDGIMMGQDVGAQLVNMWIPQAAVFGVPTTPDMTPCMVITIWGGACIMVGKDGKRHFNEDMYYEFMYDHIAELPGGYVWTIWDQEMTDLGSTRIVVPPFSEGLEEELEKGWVMKADTIVELAEKVGVDPAILIETLAVYNANVDKGEDEFGKEVGLGKVEKPPFYAAKTVPAICDTAGGLKINTQMEVVDVFDKPISRLYAAGSTTGGWRGKVYPGSGAAVSIAVGFGRMAGQNAAKNESWDNTNSKEN